MKSLTAFLVAIAAVVLMAGTSYAGGIDHGSWEEFTGLTDGTAYSGNYLAGPNIIERSGPESIITLNYTTGEIHYGTVGETNGMEGANGVLHEYYGVAPAWGESSKTSGILPKDYEVTPEIDLYLN